MRQRVEQRVLLFVELVVIFVFLEFLQEFDELLLVPNEDVDDRRRFLRVGNEDLEHMKGLELNGLGVPAQQIHHDLEVVGRIDKFHHDIEVGPVKQQLAQQFKRLALGHVVAAHQQDGVLLDEIVEIGLEKLGATDFVFGQHEFEGGESVARNVEMLSWTNSKKRSIRGEVKKEQRSMF